MFRVLIEFLVYVKGEWNHLKRTLPSHWISEVASTNDPENSPYITVEKRNS